MKEVPNFQTKCSSQYIFCVRVNHFIPVLRRGRSKIPWCWNLPQKPTSKKCLIIGCNKNLYVWLRLQERAGNYQWTSILTILYIRPRPLQADKFLRDFTASCRSAEVVQRAGHELRTFWDSPLHKREYICLPSNFGPEFLGKDRWNDGRG